MEIPDHRKTLKEIDRKYEQLECISRGEFSSVFLAKERSVGRPPHLMVAFKCIRINNDKERMDRFLLEIKALKTLNQEDQPWHREKAIVHLNDRFSVANSQYAVIVTRYVVGISLADWIAKTPTCSERRVAWCILQLCETMLYIYERGIFHYQLNPEGILVDSKNGGTLILTDFGSSSPHEMSYYPISRAPPELLDVQRSSNAAEVGLKKLYKPAIDAFAIGCIALELVAGVPITEMKQLHGRCLGDYLNQQDCCLLDLVPQMNEDSDYSAWMREHLIAALLQPKPKKRTDFELIPKLLRADPQSSLLVPKLQASFPVVYRQYVTMDNIFLGLLVQRGPDWKCNDNRDKGEGSVGIVTCLDPDALYTTVTWSNGNSGSYRIGAKNENEIVVGPPLIDGKPEGLVMTDSGSVLPVVESYGRVNLVVVHVTKSQEGHKDMIFLAPDIHCPNSPMTIEKCPIASRWIYNKIITPHSPKPFPAYWSQPHPRWNPDLPRLAPLHDQEEQDYVIEMSCALLRNGYRIISVQRIESPRLWVAYARRREEVALENWGLPNEIRLFHGTSSVTPDTIINDPIGFDPRFCDEGAFGRGSYFAANPMYSDAYRYSTPHSMTYQMIMARVTLGRVHNVVGVSAKKIRRPERAFHSVAGRSTNRQHQTSEIYVLYESATQAYPEYLITYGHA